MPNPSGEQGGLSDGLRLPEKISTKGIHEEHEGKKSYPRRGTKDHEGPLRGWWGIERGLPGVEKGGADIHEGRKGKNISTKGHEERRRATKGLEKAQEGSAKGGEGGKDFQEEAEVSVKGELFATFATGQVILPANVMFCLFQYRVRPGEKCGFTTKSTKVTKRIFRNPSRDAGCEDIHAGRRPSAGSDHTKPARLGRFSWFRFFLFLCLLWPFPAKIPLPHFANASSVP